MKGKAWWISRCKDFCISIPHFGIKRRRQLIILYHNWMLWTYLGYWRLFITFGAAEFYCSEWIWTGLMLFCITCNKRHSFVWAVINCWHHKENLQTFVFINHWQSSFSIIVRYVFHIASHRPADVGSCSRGHRPSDDLCGSRERRPVYWRLEPWLIGTGILSSVESVHDCSSP